MALRRPRHPIPSLSALAGLIALLWCAALAPATARAAEPSQCSLAAEVGADGISALTVTCSRHVEHGDIVVEFNRAPRGHATALATDGRTLACGTQRFAAADGTRAGRVTCSGFLDEFVPTRIALRLVPSPCDLPDLRMTLRVSFGDGTAFSRVQQDITCPRAFHVRHFEFFGVARSTNRHVISGAVAPDDGFARCVTAVPVHVQRLVGSTWRTIARLRTGTGGFTDGTRLFAGELRRGGTLRAVAPRMVVDNQICPMIVSEATA